jgi:hypothetical protein
LMTFKNLECSITNMPISIILGTKHYHIDFLKGRHKVLVRRYDYLLLPLLFTHKSADITSGVSHKPLVNWIVR